MLKDFRINTVDTGNKQSKEIQSTGRGGGRGGGGEVVTEVLFK